MASFVAGGQPRWAVFAGASLALIATAGLAVLVGESPLRVVPAEYLQLAAGCVEA